MRTIVALVAIFWAEQNSVILVEGIIGNINVKLFKIWTGGLDVV